MAVTTLAGYRLTSMLRRDAEFALWRARGENDASSLLLFPVSERPAPACFGRLANEYAIRAELDTKWAVCPTALLQSEGLPILVLDDPGGSPLDFFPSQNQDKVSGDDVARFLSLAIALSAALAKLHARGLVHKDIKPANILVDQTTGAVHLTGFGFAAREQHQRQTPEPLEIIAGTFAYMAPEQTGRMNRSVDARSDLYSLGVVFYEMLSGNLPFAATDPMAWVHSHIAVLPTPPAERRTGIPTQLSAMVMKLLAKAAEERYQTANGLLADLQRCQDDWQKTGTIKAFAPCSLDFTGRLIIPEKLYGREQERAALQEAVARIVGANGSTNELILVSGYSGIGKSALVGELHRAIIEPHGLYLAGKFDQFKRDIPYASLAQAFQELIYQILCASEAEVSRWREEILQAVGSNGDLLVQLIPALEFLIGKQPAVAELAANETQNRFLAVFRQFLGAIATSDHPLVLFLDDLQWLDGGSLQLIEHLLTHPEARHFLLIGAYRDNEVGAAHPLTLTLEAIRKNGGTISDVQLAPLLLNDVNHLLADTLLCDRAQTLPLASLIHEKTAGNPFFTLQFITELHDEEMLHFDLSSRAWQWDIERIRAKGFTDNVIDLMVGKLQRLPGETLDVLKHLACIDIGAPLATLARVCGRSAEETGAKLGEALLAGFLWQQGETVRFAHDRIQEAAYSLVAPEARAAMHLQIGRLLLRRMLPKDIEGAVFDLAHQFNQGVELISDPQERSLLCHLNSLAGRKAKSSAAYASARNYLVQAVALLPEDAWNQHYEESFALQTECAECESVVGHFRDADALFDTALAHARSLPDRARVARLRIKMYFIAASFGEGIAVGLETLRLFGVNFPETDDAIPADVEVERQQFDRQMEGRKISDIINLPVAHDPKAEALIGLLADLVTASYSARPALVPLILLKALNLSIKHGNIEESCVIYSNYGMLQAALFDDLATGFEFSQMSLHLNANFGGTAQRGRLLYIHGYTFHSMRHPLSTCLPVLQQSFIACREVGNYWFAATSGAALVWLLWESGKPLNEVLLASGPYREFCRQSQNIVVDHMIQTLELLVARLRGKPVNGSEAECLALFTKAGNRYAIGHYHILQQVAHYSFGRYEEALAAAVQVEIMPSSIRAVAAMVTHYFYHALTLTALYVQAGTSQQSVFIEKLHVLLTKLKQWADACPENYQNRYLLTLAELARIEGRHFEAMRLYDEAIASARDNGFVQNEALANELAAGFFHDRSFGKIARTYLSDARYAYLRWGASDKVAELDRRHPEVVDQSLNEQKTAAFATGQFDAMAMLKSYQAISGEIVLHHLLRTLMHLVIETAGAERACLLLLRGKTLQVVAETSTSDPTAGILLQAHSVASDNLPERVINTVLRTRETVLLSDASDAGIFSDDPYVLRHSLRSLLCMPILKQGGLVGMLYLENNLATSAFTPEHVATLELLGLQAAISIENALLYQELEGRVEERTQALSAEVSERRMAEARLHQTLAELELILKHASIGILTIIRTADARRICQVNQAMEQLLGYERGELNGQDTRLIASRENGYHTIGQVYDSVLKSGRAHQCDETLRRKDGQIIMTHMVGVAIDPDDLSKGAIWLIEDITERLAAQAKLQAANDGLLTALERLRLAQDDLVRAGKLASLGSIVAGVAHELSTPIGNALIVASTMCGEAEELSKTLGAGAIKRSVLEGYLCDTRDAANLVWRNLSRAGELVENFKQVAVDQTSSHRRQFELSEIVSEIIATLRPTFKRNSFRVEREIDDHLEMDSFPGPLGQVITNLVTNTFIHGFEGREQGLVRILARRLDAEHVELQVNDDGIGIAADHLDKIFDPFFTTRLGHGGSGLGLNIVHTIVTGILGGNISASSKKGHGTTFTIHIPSVAPGRLPIETNRG